MNETIREALKQEIPSVRDTYIRMIRFSTENLFENYGKDFKKKYAGYSIYNSKNYSYFSNQIRPCLGFENNEYFLDEEKLFKNATDYAETAVLQWEHKLNEKLGELENAEVRSLGNNEFNIIGTRNGRSVQIRQQMIIKSSPKGKLFNQWPARIYVDCKAVSEAAYKKILGV